MYSLSRLKTFNLSAASTYQKLALLVLGCLYVFLTPPFRAPDEIAHFLRAFGVQEGQLVLKTHSREVADAYILWIRTSDPATADLIESRLAEFDGDVPNFAWNTSVYGPAGYLPAAVGIRLSRGFGSTVVPVNILLAAARLANLGLFLVGIYWAMSNFKAFSNVIFAIGTTPMILSLGSTVNIDFILILGALYALPLFLADISTSKRASGIIVLVFLCVLTKPTYLPIVLIPALGRPFWTQLSFKQWGIAFVALAAAALLALYWNQVNLDLFANPNPLMAQFLEMLGRDPVQQMASLRQQPILALSVLGETTRQLDLLKLGHQFVGWLGHLEFPVAGWAAGLWVINLALAISLTPIQLPKQVGWRLGAVALASVLIGYIILVLTTFIWVTAVGLSNVANVFQGRYFHPLLIPLIMTAAVLLPWKAPEPRRSHLSWLVLILALIVNIHALLTLLAGVSG
jgi:uncharacterized membrane protein